MKIVKPEKTKAPAGNRTITLQIKASVVDKVDEVAGENDVSRQKLIEAILEQVLGDKNFVLRLPE